MSSRGITHRTGAGKRKEVVVATRFSAEELGQYQAAAKGMGHGLSGWIRWVLNRAVAEKGSEVAERVSVRAVALWETV